MDAPPPGGDRSHGPLLLGTSLVTFVAVLVSVCARMFTRTFIIRQVGWDDYTIVLAAIAITVTTAFIVKQFQAGGGRHDYYLSDHGLIETSKWGDLVEIMIPIDICLVKVSICLVVRRMVLNKHLIRFIYVLIGFLIFINGGSSIILLTQCMPLSSWWNSKWGDCWQGYGYATLGAGIAQGLFSCISDFICSLLPIAILTKTQLSPRKKFEVCGLMSLGLIATGCCITRIVLFKKYNDEYSGEYEWSLIEIWAILEHNIGAVAANLPFMPSLWRYLRGKASSYESEPEPRRKFSASNAALFRQANENRLRNQGEIL